MEKAMAPQCSCLENAMDGGAWWAAVYGVAQNWRRLKRQQQQQQHWREESQQLHTEYQHIWMSLCHRKRIQTSGVPQEAKGSGREEWFLLEQWCLARDWEEEGYPCFQVGCARGLKFGFITFHAGLYTRKLLISVKYIQLSALKHGHFLLFQELFFSGMN